MKKIIDFVAALVAFTILFICTTFVGAKLMVYIAQQGGGAAVVIAATSIVGNSILLLILTKALKLTRVSVIAGVLALLLFIPALLQLNVWFEIL